MNLTCLDDCAKAKGELDLPKDPPKHSAISTNAALHLNFRYFLQIDMSNTMESCSQTLQTVRERVGQVVVGQEALVERLLLALLCNGHVLLEGVPGVAKTLTVNSLAKAIKAQFSRIQFTPDLLPGDLTGTLVYDPREHTFTPEKGPCLLYTSPSPRD